MKIQDIAFIITLLSLIYKRSPKWTVVFGIVSLLLSIPLFTLWVFFTAERLTWYAAGFFLLAIIFFLLNARKYRGN
ncbi:MAG: hypothetical protein HYT07_02605 [Candidatus Levybacteria bacterium]|nr:hypothetical protein [Candidatus Levybacteria bacterium]